MYERKRSSRRNVTVTCKSVNRVSDGHKPRLKTWRVKELGSERNLHYVEHIDGEGRSAASEKDNEGIEEKNILCAMYEWKRSFQREIT